MWREARALVWRHRRVLAAGLALMAVSRVAALALPVGTRSLIDDVIGRGHAGRLGVLIAVMAGALAVESVAGYAMSQVVAVGAERAVATLRQEMQARVVSLPIGVFDRTSTGALVSRVLTDTEYVRVVLAGGLVQLAGGALTAVLALGVLVWINWRLAVLTTAVMAVFGWLMVRGFARYTNAFSGVGEATAGLIARLMESLSAIRVVKAYAAERVEMDAFAERSHGVRRAATSMAGGVSMLAAACTAARGAAVVLLLLVGGRSVMAHGMSVGDLVMCVVLAGMLVTPVVQVAASGGEIGKAGAALVRLAEVRGWVTEAEEDRRLRPLRRGGMRGRVAFEHVCYAYGRGAPAVLRGVSFVAEPGTVTALVGRTGSGKSTVCRLLMAFDRPTGGRVVVDGRDLATIPRRDYRAHLGVVLQDNVLFDATVAENIHYGRPDATDGQVHVAGRLAHCEEFVKELSKGYDTMVGERGVTLSGGQRQRIAIARAILADPRILILDEATSSLDPESEALVQDALRALVPGRTTFVIAHRPSTLRDADQILVLDGGRIVERRAREDQYARYRDSVVRALMTAQGSADGR